MHTLFGKISLILSLIGIIGGIFVPIFQTIDNRYWGEQIHSEMVWFFFIFFAIISIIGITLGYYSKGKRSIWILCDDNRFCRFPL